MRFTLKAMAAYLAHEVPDLANDRRCLNALLAAGFNRSDVFRLLDQARELARDRRAAEADKLVDDMMGNGHVPL